MSWKTKNAAVGVTTDRHTDTQTDTSDFIICPMLCYSNGTDNYCNAYFFSAYISSRHDPAEMFKSVISVARKIKHYFLQHFYFARNHSLSICCMKQLWHTVPSYDSFIILAIITMYYSCYKLLSYSGIQCSSAVFKTFLQSVSVTEFWRWSLFWQNYDKKFLWHT